GFYYTRYPQPDSVPPGDENYHRRVFFHRLGSPWRDDPLVFGADREREDWPSVQLSPDGRWLAVSVSRGWTRTDVYLLDRHQAAGCVKSAEGEEPLSPPSGRADRLYLHTNRDASRSRLVVVDLRNPAAASWRTLVPEGEDVLEAVAVVGERILALRLR